VVDFVRDVARKTEISERKVITLVGVARGKYFEWCKRYGKANEHNGDVPRDNWLLPEERQRILDFHEKHPLEGYRRLTFMMNDAGVVAASPTTVHRVLQAAGRLDRWTRRPTRKGSGFEQPETPHQHWHIDIAYLNLGGTFYYLISVLDGASRAIVHWDIRESMTELDVELVLQRAHEQYPGTRPRIISDNGPQFIARDFKEFIRVTGMSHVRIRPYYPQSNGKIERMHRTLKSESIRRHQPRSKEEAEKVVRDFVHHYNHERLHSGIGYVPPIAVLEGRRDAIHAARDQRLEAARDERARRRRALASQATTAGTEVLHQPNRNLEFDSPSS
jgi:transposase InsO family protein